jgi:hypothetical protein
MRAAKSKPEDDARRCAGEVARQATTKKTKETH